MKTPENSDAKAIDVQRFVRPCRCKYQAEKSWGYDLCEWVGGKESWKNHGSATHLEDVERYARKLKRVLIRCNGCGADVLREYSQANNYYQVDSP
jgi:hypothetical protein